MAKNCIYTIGHSTCEFDEVLEMLRENGVTELVDVRSLPGSRKFPQWSRETKAFRDYADYIATEEFRSGLEELLAVSRKRVSAIMCGEAVPWRCHRRLITDACPACRGDRGAEHHVDNLNATRNPQPATLTDFAEVNGRDITYPKPADQVTGSG